MGWEQFLRGCRLPTTGQPTGSSPFLSKLLLLLTLIRVATDGLHSTHMKMTIASLRVTPCHGDHGTHVPESHRHHGDHGAHVPVAVTAITARMSLT